MKERYTGKGPSKREKEKGQLKKKKNDREKGREFSGKSSTGIFFLLPFSNVKMTFF